MKRSRFMTLIIALIGAISIGMISDLHAIKLCQLDWFNSWVNLGNSTELPNGIYAYTGSFTDGAPGTWSVTSTQGSTPVKHTVSGMATCNTSNSYSDATSVDPTTPSNNKNCWCRMTSPNLGGSWMFLYTFGSAGACARNCAYECTLCIRYGTRYSSCSRSALLALP
jgi:hypothetical protein